MARSTRRRPNLSDVIVRWWLRAALREALATVRDAGMRVRGWVLKKPA